MTSTKPLMAQSTWGQLPASLRVLFISDTCSFSDELAIAIEAYQDCRIELEQSQGIVVGLARLRNELFDAVLVGHEDASLNALELLDSIRAGSSHDQPVLVLGIVPAEELAGACLAAGAAAYLDLTTTTTSHLIWRMAQAAERQQLIAENRRLKQNHQQQSNREAEEAQIRWEEQAAMIGISTWAASSLSDTALSGELPANLMGYYREVLQTYIIMGSGRLTAEVGRLVDLLVVEGMSSESVLRLHLAVVKDMVAELGNRSARHVVNRADGLIIDLLQQIAEGYRRQLLASHLIPPNDGLRPEPDANCTSPAELV